MTDTHAMHNHNSVITEIIAERERQIAKGYDAEHDDALKPQALAVKAIVRIHHTNREKMIEAAALILAAVAKLDRKALRESGNG